MGLVQSVAVNMLGMIGVGPFITIGVILSAMGGPQAVLGWFLGALFSVCDGMVYAELGAAMPGAGGAYIYFREAFNPRTWGHLFSFLFLWETIFVAPLAISAAMRRFCRIYPLLLTSIEPRRSWRPRRGDLCAHHVSTVSSRQGSGALLSDHVGVWCLAAMFWVIVSGLIHINTKMAFDFPPGAFHLSKSFFYGLAGATLIAMYNYGGYNNITYLGGEVKNPGEEYPQGHCFLRFDRCRPLPIHERGDHRDDSVAGCCRLSRSRVGIHR